MSKPNGQRILDMLDATDKAIAFAAGKSRGDLDENEMLALALVRLLEIVGEAARFVPDEIKEANPQVPWREIAGTRDRLIHGYFAVDLDIVWSIVEQDLPPLSRQLKTVLESD